MRSMLATVLLQSQGLWLCKDGWSFLGNYEHQTPHFLDSGEFSCTSLCLFCMNLWCLFMYDMRASQSPAHPVIKHRVCI